MRFIIEYIKSLFCDHDFDYTHEHHIYNWQNTNYLEAIEKTYICKKCGYVKKIKLGKK